MRILICGGGVIGASIAWFLAKRGAEPVVIERTGVANAASGKSGGFLASDWCDGTVLAPLARRSFALHASLAEEIADDWGYRRVETYGGYAGTKGAVAGGRWPGSRTTLPSRSASARPRPPHRSTPAASLQR